MILSCNQILKCIFCDFASHACRMQGEEEDVADEQEPEGEDLVGGDGEDDSDEEVPSD